MSQSGSPNHQVVDEDLLRLLAELEQSAALAHLLTLFDGIEIALTDAVTALAVAAFVNAENAPQKASRWLALAQALHAKAPQAANSAQIAHAQARLHLQQGQLSAAEGELRLAQAIWQTLGNSTAVARTFLGLTQILTLQGNYIDAQVASRDAIALLDTAVLSTPALTPLLITALRNAANLAGYLHDHQRALDTYAHAQQRLASYRSLTVDAETAQQLAAEEASIAVSRAVDLMALAHLQEAEQALRSALFYFEHTGNHHHSSYARSNLASLYARSGQYIQALAAFEQAIESQWGTGIQLDQLPIEELYCTDVMLLDQAMVFLALNLQREALHAITLAEQIFAHTQRPYELGQALYARGLLHMQALDWPAAVAALAQAATIFADLHNRYWQNRITLARIALLQHQGEDSSALALLAPLMAGNPTRFEEQWYGWDLGTAVELYLQQLQLSLQTNDLDAARVAATVIAQLFEHHFPERAADTALFTQEHPTGALIPFGVPHLRFAYFYALGRIERVAGDMPAARRYFQQAVTLLEAQRATLPLEEIRIAFLADKVAVYTDWLLALIDVPDAATPEIAEAFGVVERARSRALLERLLAALDDPLAPVDDMGADGASTQPQLAALFEADAVDPATQRTQARRHLHWLYNQLLGQAGTRRLLAEELQMIRQLEFRLEQLEVKSALPITATAVNVHALQAVLQPNEQVLAYYIADEEVLLFAVTTTTVRLYRRLCTLAELRKAQRDLHFLMGRLRSGDLLLQTLDHRAQRLLQQVLHRLYQLLVAPIGSLHQIERLTIIPYGVLHSLPFHAFWTGEAYLIERVDCCYAPSASIVVHQTERAHAAAPMHRWSGLAVTDQGIPETATEIKMIAPFFVDPQLYLGVEAGRGGLAKAARESDILHISTHGLMRSDNALFSALKLADGWIDVREIYRLNLRAQLVVLSACRSGFSQIDQGDELMGLVRGFLGAGAHTLLVSQWDVDDRYAPTFMAQFYQHLTQDQQTPVAALRRAQCQAIAAGHHPFWWAPFFVIG